LVEPRGSGTVREIGVAEVQWDSLQKLVQPRDSGTVREIGGAEMQWEY
jgi:hypothetical protein